MLNEVNKNRKQDTDNNDTENKEKIRDRQNDRRNEKLECIVKKKERKGLMKAEESKESKVRKGKSREGERLWKPNDFK